MIFTNDVLNPAEAVRILGLRFREYRMHIRLTRKDVSEASGIGMTTLYRFETGHMTDISFVTLFRLLRVLGLSGNWEALLPALPESPYLYYDNGKKAQRIRKRKSEL